MSRRLQLRPLRPDDGSRLDAALSRLRASIPSFPPGHDPKGVAAAARAVLSPEVLARSFGGVAWDGSEPVAAVVATTTPSPWRDAWTEAVVHTAFASEGAGAAFGGLVERTLAAARVRDVALIRSRLLVDDDALLASRADWRIGYVFVGKAVERRRAEDHPICVRPARRDDGAFVLELIRRGLEEGLVPGEKSRVDAADLQRAARTYLSRLRAKGTAYCAVAERGGDRVGASVVDMDDVCETIGRRQAYVHDVYVLPSNIGRGVAQRLYADIESVAHDAGAGWLGATVSAATEEATRARLASIARTGWAPAYVSRFLDLPGSNLTPASAAAAARRRRWRR